MFLNIGKYLIRVLAHLEEIGILCHFLYRTVAVRAAAILVQLMLRPVAFARRTVKALIGTFIDIALGIDAVEDLLDHFLMTFLRRADKVIIADVQALPEVLETSHDLIRVLDWLDSCFFGLLLDLLTMLIRARQEEYIITGQTLEPGNRVRNGRAVSMTDMQLGTRIVDRGRDIKWFLFCHGK